MIGVHAVVVIADVARRRALAELVASRPVLVSVHVPAMHRAKSGGPLTGPLRLYLPSGEECRALPLPLGAPWAAWS